MTKQEFKHLFDVALETAAVNAEQKIGYKIPRHFRVLMHGAGHSGDLMDLTTVVEELYLGEDKFYRIIDVSVVEVDKQSTVVFVRPSQHKPGSFEQTWNNPPGSGPFKQIIAKTVKFKD